MSEYEKTGLKLIIFRLVIALTFLSSSIGLQIALGEKLLLKPYFYFSAFVLILEICYILFYSFFKKWRNREIFIYIQLVGDSITVIVLLFYTGGHSSVFVFLLHFLVVLAGSLLKSKGAFFISLINGLLFGLLCLSLYYGWLRPSQYFNMVFEIPTAGEIFNALMVNFLGFFLVALLISAVSGRVEQSRKELGDAQKGLKYLEHINDLIVSSISGGIAVTDLNGRVTFSTPKARSFLGVNISEGWSLKEQIEKLGGPSLNFENLSNEGIEMPLSLPSERHLMFSISSLFEEGKKIGYLALVRDETELVKIRNKLELKERLISLGEMAANMAHEIKNPLGSISGAAQMLKDASSTDQSEKELLSIIHKESLRLAEVLDNFLRFASPQPPEKHNVNLVELINEVLMLFKKNPPFVEKKLKLQFDYPEKEIFTRVDPNQFKQVLWNLLQNARKASSYEGEIRISISKKGKWIVVGVSDNGTGMPKSEIEKIQEPFKKGFLQGVGLGLTVVNRIMEQHNGKVEIETRYGSGTTVKLFFPVDEK